MFLEFIFKENRLFTLLKLGFASQNCGCMKPPEWPSPQPSPYLQPRPQPPREPQTPRGVERRTAVSTWSHSDPQSRVRADSGGPAQT